MLRKYGTSYGDFNSLLLSLNTYVSYLQVEKFKKRETLIETLKDVGTDRTLVFVETKKNADFLACILSNEGFPTTSIHGDRLQRERSSSSHVFTIPESKPSLKIRTKSFFWIYLSIFRDYDFKCIFI